MKNNYLKLGLIACALFVYSTAFAASVDYTLTADDITLDANGYITDCSYDFTANPDGTNLIMPNNIDISGIANAIVNDYGDLDGTPTFSKKNITSITLPDNITYIGSYALIDNQLTSIIIPEGVVEIGRDAFKDNMIATVNIPSTVKSIGANCFYENAELTEITFADNSQLVNIGSHAFVYTAITSITLPSSVVPDNNFICWLKLDNTTVEVQAGVPVSPGNTAFVAKYTYTLTANDVTVADGVITGIINKPFTKYLAIPSQIDGQEIIGLKGTNSQKSALFYGWGIYDVTLPNTLQTIGTMCFNSNSIKNLTIPASVTTIENYAFWSAFSRTLPTITFESNSKLSYIGYQALKSTGLEVSLPTSNKEGFTFRDWINEYDDTFASGQIISSHSTSYTARYTIATSIKASDITSFNIAPNPASTYFSIEGVQNQHITIYTVSGTIAKQIYVSSSEQKINVSDLSRGVYIIKSDAHTQKLILQ